MSRGYDAAILGQDPPAFQSATLKTGTDLV